MTRLAYDDAWCEAHRWLAAQARERGLEATADGAGNLFFHPPSVTPGDPARPVLLVGSHLDSVREGGRYDGAYGVVAGMMLAVAAARRAGAGHAEAESAGAGGAAADRAAAGIVGASSLPLVGYASAEEEDSRFHGGLMGARSMVGRVDAAELDRVADDEGVTWRDALKRAGERGCCAPALRPLFRAAAEIELHIEQGPELEAAGIDIGIVEVIAGYRRVKLSLEGEARHAGTTPMRLRHDALAAAAECALAAEALAREAGPPAVATAGRMDARPGLFNVVPGDCELWLELRHGAAAELERLTSTLESRCREAAARRGVRVNWGESSRQQPQALSSGLAMQVEALAGRTGLSARRMVSGAGHDTMVFARAGVPSLMIFVPSRGGVSHSPDEFTEPRQLWNGLRLAQELCRVLCDSPERIGYDSISDQGVPPERTPRSDA